MLCCFIVWYTVHESVVAIFLVTENNNKNTRSIRLSPLPHPRIWFFTLLPVGNIVFSSRAYDTFPQFLFFLFFFYSLTCQVVGVFFFGSKKSFNVLRVCVCVRVSAPCTPCVRISSTGCFWHQKSGIKSRIQPKPARNRKKKERYGWAAGSKETQSAFWTLTLWKFDGYNIM